MSSLSLPPELLGIIFNYYPVKEADLACAARVCRAWRLPANRQLYRELDLQGYLTKGNGNTPRRIGKIARTLQDQPTLQQFVKIIIVLIEDLDDTTQCRQDLCRLITLCTLSEIDLCYSGLDLLVELLPQAINSLTYLTVWLIGREQDFVGALARLPACPALRTLVIQAELRDRYIPPRSHDPRSPYHLDNLGLHCYPTVSSDLIDMFTRSHSDSSLKSLDLTLQSDDYNPTGVVPIKHLTSLEKFKLHYQYWDLAIEYWIRDVACAAREQLSQLSGAKRLKHVSISLANPGGTSERSFGPDTRRSIARTIDADAVWEAFPPSVETIAIYAPVSTLSARRLLSAKYFKNLKQLKFSLCTTVDEDEDQDRRQLELLAQKKGVQLKFTKIWSPYMDLYE